MYILFLFLILFAALISGGQLITSNHMKTSRHLTETPGARERTSEIGDDKPETLARGASNFQTHHMFRPINGRTVLLPHIPRRNQRPIYKPVFTESSDRIW